MKTVLNFLWLTILFISFACGGGNKMDDKSKNEESSKSKEENSPKTGIDQIDKTLADIDKAKEERKKRGDTLAMNYKDLQKYLPKSPKGYELKGSMKGETLNMTGLSFSKATAEYKKGDDEIEVALFDYNQAFQVFQGLAMIWSMGISEENDERKAGTINYKGHKGWEEFNKKTKDAKILLGINDRFYLEVKAENQKDTDFLKSIIDEMNIADLSSK
jgi:hypothetical protein